MVAKKRPFSNRIRDLRRAHKMTQAQLAEKLGIDNTTVSKWEADIYEPNSDMLNKLAIIFDKPVDYLLGRDESKSATVHEEPIVQFLMRTKEEMSPESFARFTRLIEAQKKAFMDEVDRKLDGDKK